MLPGMAPTTETPPFEVPGRGAWRLTGGLLTARPASTSRVGYYRLATAGEAPVGSAWARTTDPVRTYSTWAVHLAVRALQRLAGLTGATVDGWHGPVTDAAVRALQNRVKVTVDGIAGPATMRAALKPLIADIADGYRVPTGLIGGLAVIESALDPGAVGTNGADSGLVQINRAAGAHPEVAAPDAFDPPFALQWAAQQLRGVHDQWSGETTADPWDIAVANHNSPQLATQWARTGTPPVVARRIVQIEDYVVRVRTAWDAA
jgi:hypothetical protein